MFKRCLAIFVAFLICCCLWATYSKPMFFDYVDEFESYSYLKSAGQIERQNIQKFTYDFIRYGEGFTLDEEEVKKLNLTKEEIFSRFNAEEVFCFITDYGKSFYGYSKKIKYCEKINGKKVNLHVFVANDGSFSVGSPIIYGSF